MTGASAVRRSLAGQCLQRPLGVDLLEGGVEGRLVGGGGIVRRRTVRTALGLSVAALGLSVAALRLSVAALRLSVATLRLRRVAALGLRSVAALGLW